MEQEKNKNPKGTHTQKPIKVFRSGAIAASVWKRQTSTGFEYLDFSLSRSWKLKSGEKEGYSTSFFHKNEAAISEVVQQASEFIRCHNISIQSENPKHDVPQDTDDLNAV